MAIADRILVLEEPSATEVAADDRFWDEAERRGLLVGDTVDFPTADPPPAFSLWLNNWLIKCLTAFFLDLRDLALLLLLFCCCWSCFRFST